MPIRDCPECGIAMPCKCEKRKNPTYGELFAAGKFDDSTMKTKSDNYCRCSKCIEQKEETTPAPTPWSAKSEAYWHNQYQLMREKFWKQIDINSKQAERIRELEEHSTKQDFLIDELADSLRAMVAHCEGFISNLKEGK